MQVGVVGGFVFLMSLRARDQLLLVSNSNSAGSAALQNTVKRINS